MPSEVKTNSVLVLGSREQSFFLKFSKNIVSLLFAPIGQCRRPFKGHLIESEITNEVAAPSQVTTLVVWNMALKVSDILTPREAGIVEGCCNFMQSAFFLCLFRKLFLCLIRSESCTCDCLDQQVLSGLTFVVASRVVLQNTSKAWYAKQAKII